MLFKSLPRYRFLLRSALPVLLLACAPPMRGEAPPVPATIPSYADLQLEPGSVLAAPVDFQAEGMQVSLRKGTLARVKSNGGATGVYFQGEGEFTFRSRDSLEFPALSYNLKANTQVDLRDVDGARMFRAPIREGLFWFAGRPVPFPVTRGGVDLGPPFLAFQKYLNRAWFAPIEQLLVQQSANAPDTPVLVAKLRGEHTWIYQEDRVDEYSAALHLLYERPGLPSDLEKPLFAALVSQQPLGWSFRVGREPNFRVTKVKLDVRATDGKDVTVEAVETLVPTREGQRAFAFQLLSETWAGAGAGLHRRYHRLVSVTDEQGRPVPYEHLKHRLVVMLPKPAAAGRPFTLRFRIEGDFLVREDGDNAWKLGISAWFPQGEFSGMAFQAEARVSVPKPFTPIMGGTVVSRREEGGQRILETRFDQPVPDLVVQAGDYRLTEETRNGVTIRLWNYAKENSQAKRVVGLGFDVIGFFEKLIGPFPFKELDIIEQNDWGYGQAPAGVVFITKEAFNQIHTMANRYFSKGINARFAHEIAHQYWGNQVRWTMDEDQWLSEAFAEISGALFVRWAYGREGMDRYQVMLNEWKEHATEAAPRGTIPFANRPRNISDPVNAWKTRTYLLYDKGAYLLSRVHQEIGDAAFSTFLHAYVANFKWKAGGTRHVPGLLKALTRKDWEPFFEANYWGTGLP